MPISNDSASTEGLRMGPIKVVQVFTAHAAKNRPVTEKLGYESVPFDQVRHLCSGKPLARYAPGPERS